MEFKIDVPENVTEPLAKPFENLTDKPTHSLGKGLSNIFELVFAPFGYLNGKQQLYYQNKLKKYEQELANKEREIPQERLTEPDFHTVSLALENSKSCITDDELRKMFVNLIGCSMDSSTSSLVHPSFSDIIKQMSTLDAKVLASFELKMKYPIFELRKKSSQNGYSVLMTNLFSNVRLNIGEKVDLMKIPSSISNLNRLGLIEIDYMQYLVDEQRYNGLEKTAEILYDSSSIPVENRLTQKGIVFLTPLGENFVKVCLSD